MTRTRGTAVEPHEYYALVQEIDEIEHTIAVIRTRRSAPDEIWLRCGDAGRWHPMYTSVPERASPLVLRPRYLDPGREPEGTLLIADPADSPLMPMSSLSITGRRRGARRAQRTPSSATSRYEQMEIAIGTEQPLRPPSPIPPPPPTATLHPPGESSRRWFSLR